VTEGVKEGVSLTKKENKNMVHMFDSGVDVGLHLSIKIINSIDSRIYYMCLRPFLARREFVKLTYVVNLNYLRPN
jgi:hypothetical protein